MNYLITVSSIIELIYFDPRGIEIGPSCFPVWDTIPPKVAANCSLQYTFHPEDLLLLNLFSSKLYLQYVACSIEVNQQSINQCYTEQCIQ